MADQEGLSPDDIIMLGRAVGEGINAIPEGMQFDGDQQWDVTRRAIDTKDRLLGVEINPIDVSALEE